jgi:hypothetical protein
MSEARQVAKTYANRAQQPYEVIATHTGLYYVTPTTNAYIMAARGYQTIQPDPAILCAAHTDPYILEQAYEQDEADYKEIGYTCQCGQQLTFGDWVYGSDTLYECPACHTIHDTDPDLLNNEPTIAGEVTGYDNGPTFW